MRKQFVGRMRRFLAVAPLAAVAMGCPEKPKEELTEPKLVPVVVSATGHDRFYGVTHDGDGNIYAVGQVADSTETAADYRTVVAKFDPMGELDSSFGQGGFAIHNVTVAASGNSGEVFRGIAVQSTGKIVVAGTVDHLGAVDARDRDIAVMRLNADGSKDTSFGTGGIVTLDLSTGAVNGSRFSADSQWSLVKYADDRLLISGGAVRTGGVDTDFALVRLTADGARDDTFGTNGLFTLDTLENAASNNASPRGVILLPGTEGIIGSGYQPLTGADTKPAVFKVTDSGVLDASFGAAGVYSEVVLAEQSEVYKVARQSDGKLVTTGYGRQLSTEATDILSLRLNADGTRDATYGANGLVRLDVGGYGDNSRDIAVLHDNSVLLVGGGRPTADNVEGLVARFDANGQPMTSFGTNGARTFDLGGPADFLWAVSAPHDNMVAAAVGLKGVANPPVAGANDDAVLLLLPVMTAGE